MMNKSQKRYSGIIFLLFLMVSGAHGLFGAETTIKGGKMTLLNQGEKVVFTGGVRLVREGDILKARRMETNRGRDKIKAQGDVDLYRQISSTQSIQGFGAEGYYESKNGVGFLERGKKKARVIYTEVVSSTQTRTVDIYADRFDFLSKKEEATGKGNVYGKTVDLDDGGLFEFWADQADYFGEEKKIVLTGEDQPKVLKTLNGEIRRVVGDKIIFFVDTKEFVSEGNAEAFLQDPKDNESSR